MHTKHLCLKHRQLDCKCGSPLNITIGYKTRIPQKDKINQWKKFLDYIKPTIERNDWTKKTITHHWK